MRQALNIRHWLACCMLVLASACGTLQAPQTNQDRLAYAYAGLAGTYQTIAGLADRGRLSKAEGRAAIDRADAIRLSLDSARLAMGQGNDKEAVAALNAALYALQAIENHLKTKAQP